MKKLISFGEILVDQFRSNTKQSLECFAGGAPANVAVCYSKLGGDSYFVGGIGTDENAKFLLEELNKAGVNTRYIKFFSEAKTATALISLDEKNERSFEISRDATADILFRKEDFNQSMFQQGDFLHFCSNTLTEQSIFEATDHAIETAFNHDMIVCFDVNLRFDLWSDQSTIEKRVASFYSRCDIIKMSLNELEYLAEKNEKLNKSYISQCIDLGVSLVIVTDGENAIKGYTKMATITINPPKIKVEDTTAAGDAFIGGFLQCIGNSMHSEKSFKRFSSSKELIKKALEFAAVCGAITCLTKGAFNALPIKTEVDKFKNNVQTN